MDVVVASESGAAQAPTLTFMSSLSPSNKLFAQESHKEVWVHRLKDENWPQNAAKNLLKNIAIFKLREKTFLAHQCLFSSKHKCNCSMLQNYLMMQPRVNPRENLNHLVLGDVGLTFYNVFAFALRNDAVIVYAKLGGKEVVVDELRDYVLETNRTAHGIDVKMQLKLARVFMPTKSDDFMRRYNSLKDVELTPVLLGNFSQLSDKAKLLLTNSPETELSEIFR